MVHRRTAVPRGAVLGGIALALGLAAPPAGAQTGLIRIYGVGVPSAPTARWGTRNTVAFNVRVRNDSSGAAPCLVRVELEGVATSSASPVITIPAGTVTLVPVSVDVDLTRIPSGGDRLPFSVALLDARRQELSRFPGALAVIPVAAAPLSVTPGLVRPEATRFSRDIALERIGYAAPHGETAAGFVMVVRNRGRERWSYPATIGSQIALGTPETHLEWSDRFSLGSAPLPPGIAPGDSAVVVLRLQPVTVGTGLGNMRMVPNLPTDLWLTVRGFVSTNYDVNSSNDAVYFVLRLGGDRRVAESRTLLAPALSVRVKPR